MSETRADALFDSYMHYCMREGELCDYLSHILRIQWEDFTFDSYDCSLEIYGCSPEYVMPEDHKQKLRDWGFDQVWTHTRQMRGEREVRDGHEVGENWYSLRDFSKQRLAK